MNNYQQEIDLLEERLAVMREDWKTASPAMRAFITAGAKLKKERIEFLKRKMLLDNQQPLVV